jgi:nanoRNase/pAp phosphatase (c-di-AMP/oligoRNAs hydrolase)
MSSKTDFLIKGLKIVSWIIFIGLCIETGAFLFNYVFSLFKPIATQNLYKGLNLSQLYNQSKTSYTFLFSFLIIISVLKAYIFYIIIKLFQKLNFVKPFSNDISQLISKVSYCIFSVGLIGLIAHQYTKQLIQKGFNVNEVENYWNDSGAFLMMAAIVFVIAHIFKKGMELQNENDLTV